MTDYNCVDVLLKLVWAFVCSLRSKDCRKLWEGSLHLSVNKRVPCGSWLSPWSSQVQRDACWNTCLATLWPHKLSLAITSWPYCASGNIHTCGWRNEVRHRTTVAECQLTRYSWHSQADCCRLFIRSVITWEICAEVMKQKVLEVNTGPLFNWATIVCQVKYDMVYHLIPYTHHWDHNVAAPTVLHSNCASVTCST